MRRWSGGPKALAGLPVAVRLSHRSEDWPGILKPRRTIQRVHCRRTWPALVLPTAASRPVLPDPTAHAIEQPRRRTAPTQLASRALADQTASPFASSERSVRARESAVVQQVRAGHVIRQCTKQLLDDHSNFFRPAVLGQRDVRGLFGQAPAHSSDRHARLQALLNYRPPWARHCAGACVAAPNPQRYLVAGARSATDRPPCIEKTKVTRER